MNDRVLPAVIATIYAVVLTILLFVPFVAREYRKRGELGAGTALLWFAWLLYLSGLGAYVLIPLPPRAPGLCDAFVHLQPQLRPFNGLDGVRPPGTWSELPAFLSYEPIQLLGFNILLFIPLGMFVRYLFRRGFISIAVIGLGMSLMIELTQITGLWFLYPCPYRLFDVDDLMANTFGAVLGRVVAPSLRLLPQQYSGVRPTTPRTITKGRRLLGMTCDVMLLFWIGTTGVPIADYYLKASRMPGRLHDHLWLEATAMWFGPAVLLLIAALIARGSTLGQQAVRLHPVTADNARPGMVVVLGRWLVGLGGLALVQGALKIADLSALWLPVTLFWAVIHAIGVTNSRDYRGISGRLVGLYVTDARRRAEPERATADA